MAVTFSCKIWKGFELFEGISLSYLGELYGTRFAVKEAFLILMRWGPHVQTTPGIVKFSLCRIGGMIYYDLLYRFLLYSCSLFIKYILVLTSGA